MGGRSIVHCPCCGFVVSASRVLAFEAPFDLDPAFLSPHGLGRGRGFVNVLSPLSEEETEQLVDAFLVQLGRAARELGLFRQRDLEIVMARSANATMKTKMDDFERKLGAAVLESANRAGAPVVQTRKRRMPRNPPKQTIHSFASLAVRNEHRMFNPPVRVVRSEVSLEESHDC
jgi:hypothetical protein